MSDPVNFDFDEYIRQSEPDKQQKGYIWQTAIGLQDVDGLKPSEYLLETAKKNIDGDITLEEANELISYTSDPEGKTRVLVGVCGANNDQWKAVQKVLDDENAGIYIELVEFDAYNLPNEALHTGEIDLNAFQHKAYMNKDAADNGYDVVSIGDTLIAPLTLYSRQFDSLDALKEAAGTV
jgi:ABC-type metal ion transport system substrate-binding protein